MFKTNPKEVRNDPKKESFHWNIDIFYQELKRMEAVLTWLLFCPAERPTESLASIDDDATLEADDGWTFWAIFDAAG